MASEKTDNFVNLLRLEGKRKVPGLIKSCMLLKNYSHKFLQTLWLFRIFIHLKVGSIFEKIAQVILKLSTVFLM